MSTEALILVRIIEDTDGPASGLDRVTVSFDPADPLVVRLTFDPATCASVDDGEPPEWRLDRATLARGGGVPGADLVVDRSSEYVTVALSSPEGRCVMRFLLADLDRFLAETFDAVPLGEEITETDIDAALATLLGSTP